jgi:hypothetical protein
MKTKTSILAITKAFFILLVMCCLFSSCNNEVQYDGLVLTDENTGKKYLLKHNVGDTYFIDEQVLQISGKDTTMVFK